jgi:hypothetical protein
MCELGVRIRTHNQELEIMVKQAISGTEFKNLM